jgi:hypothetical protein
MNYSPPFDILRTLDHVFSVIRFVQKRGMDSDLEGNNRTGSTGSLRKCGLRPKDPWPQAKKFRRISC